MGLISTSFEVLYAIYTATKYTRKKNDIKSAILDSIDFYTYK